MGSLRESIVIVGSGVAGLATALALHRIGVPCLVLEQASYLRTTGAAFTLLSNGWTALEALGIANDIRAVFYELEGGKVFSNGGDPRIQIPMKQLKVEMRCVERKVLLEKLVAALPPNSIRFNSKVVSITETSNSSMEVRLSDGTSITANIVIGCDGVNSTVARLMGMGNSCTSGRSALRGIGTLPHGKVLDSKAEKWGCQMTGKGITIGYAPCRDDRVFWFICRTSIPWDSLTWKDPESVRQAALECSKEFPKEFGDLIKVSEVETLHQGELKTKWVWPWEWEQVYGGKGCVALAGDAMHSMWPDLSQGACLSLEDAVVLARNLSEAGLEDGVWNKEKMGKVEVALRKYRDERKWRVLMVAAMSNIAGTVLNGSSTIARLLRDKVMFHLGTPTYITSYAKYNCGTLPSPKWCRHEVPSHHALLSFE